MRRLGDVVRRRVMVVVGRRWVVGMMRAMRIAVVMRIPMVMRIPVVMRIVVMMVVWVVLVAVIFWFVVSIVRGAGPGHPVPAAVPPASTTTASSIP